MANTIDVVLVTGISDSGIDQFIKESGLDFCKLDNDAAGGSRILCLDVYAYAGRTTGTEIDKLISAFKSTTFGYPELVSLTIDDDSKAVSLVLTKGDENVI